MHVSPSAAKSLIKIVARSGKGGSWGAANSCRKLAQAAGKTCCTAATRYWRKRSSALSYSSSESQQTFGFCGVSVKPKAEIGHLKLASHWLTRLVLPKPAGATTSVRV